MPHAEQDNMSAPTMNGEKPTSAFLDHLVSYPVVSDSITTFKKNPYGQKSIAMADTGYATFAKPIMPYLSRPYQYVSPYVHRADSLADSGLNQLETSFPAVKKPTDELRNDFAHVAILPLRFAGAGKEYVLKTYGSECKKVGGDGLVTYGKAAVTTSLVVTSDCLSWISQFLSAKKEEAKEVANEKTNN